MRSQQRQRDKNAQRQKGRGHHRAKESRARRAGLPLRFTGGLPFQQTSAAENDTVKGAENRIHADDRIIGKKDQGEAHLGQLSTQGRERISRILQVRKVGRPVRQIHQQ